jgi:membrane-associated phospholipid phosphatase
MAPESDGHMPRVRTAIAEVGSHTVSSQRGGTVGREVVLALLVTCAYFLTRGLVRGRAVVALAHAHDILNIEQTLHLDPEVALQHLALLHPLLLQAANLFYLVGHLPVLIAVAIWLYRAHHRAYRIFRNAFGLTALAGLAIYVALPVAPPRFLPGFVDTLKADGMGLDGSSIGLLYNPYAAMPSLHVGWALLAGLALVLCARPLWLRLAGAALPLLMTLTVLVTGNHFVLDVVAGMGIALLSLTCSWWLTTTGRRARNRHDPREEPLCPLA